MEIVKQQANYKNRLIYKKTATEIKKLKRIKANLSRPFMNETVVHFNADSDNPTVIIKRNNKH